MTLVVDRPLPVPLFSALKRQQPDALFAVIAFHRADPPADKTDVGVGVYRDVHGTTPVMRAANPASFEAGRRGEGPMKRPRRVAPRPATDQ